jgi:hypothetical protein
MLKLKLKTQFDNISEITLSDKSEHILADIGSLLEVKGTKSGLFSLMLGITQLSVTTLQQYGEIPPTERPEIAADMLKGLYVMGDVYDFFDNLEYTSNTD